MTLREYLNSFPRTERESVVQRIAAAVGVSAAGVRHWSNGTRRIPPEKVLEVEEVTGVSRHDLRPDVFGDKPTPVPKHPMLNLAKASA